MRVRKPRSPARWARAAVTVVLPTPPFPATMTTRDARRNEAGSTTSFRERADPEDTDGSAGPDPAGRPVALGSVRRDPAEADRGRGRGLRVHRPRGHRL